MAFIRELRVVLPALRMTWSSGRYREGVDSSSRSEEFDSQVLTDTLRSSWFSRYCDLMLCLDDTCSGLSTWAEDCICHHKFLQHYRGSRATKLLRKRCYKRKDIFCALGPNVSTCPMAGKRAPELASEKMSALFASLWQVHFSEFTIGGGGGEGEGLEPLSSEDTQALADDLEFGRAQIELLLRTKLDFWSRLP